MYVDIVDRLKSAHDELCTWVQPFKLPDGTDLSVAVGKNAQPPNVPYRPKRFPVDYKMRPRSYFMFDPALFYGPAAWERLCALIQQCCPGASLVAQNKEVHPDHIKYRLKCSHYKLNLNLVNTKFEPHKCTKPHVPPAREKKAKSKSQHSFGKMGTANLKPNRTRKRKQQPQPSSETKHDSRRTDTKMADCPEHRCEVCVVVFMCTSSQNWFLCPTTRLAHKYHASEEESSLLCEDDLMDDEKNISIISSSMASPQRQQLR